MKEKTKGFWPFKYFWVSICSAHRGYNARCHMCQGGAWQSLVKFQFKDFFKRPKVNSQTYFEKLAKWNPGKLANILVEARLPDAQLTFAAEAAGLAMPNQTLELALISLLFHGSAVVREGAIYGLTASEPSFVSQKILKFISENDKNHIIRDLAKSIFLTQTHFPRVNNEH